MSEKLGLEGYVRSCSDLLEGDGELYAKLQRFVEVQRRERAELTALRTKLAEAERERDESKQAANAWNALMTGLAAVDELDHDENADKYKAIDSYIKAWSKQRDRADALSAKLAAVLNAAQAWDAVLSTDCDCEERNNLRTAIADTVE